MTEPNPVDHRPDRTRGGARLVLGTGVTALLGLAFALHAARRLGPVESADLFGAVFVAGLLTSAFGPIGATVTRFAAVHAARGEPRSVDALVRGLRRRVRLLGGLLLLASLPLLPLLARLLRFESIWPLLLALAIGLAGVFLHLPRGVIRGRRDFAGYGLNTVLEAGVRLVTGVALLALAPSVPSALAAYLLGVGGARLAAAARLRAGSPGVEREPRGRGPTRDAVLGFAAPMYVMTGCAAAFQAADLLYVKACFPASDAGLYGAAAVFARSFALVFMPFRIMLLPVATARRERGTGSEGALLRMSLGFLVLAALPLAAVALRPDLLVRLLYGGGFVEATPLLLPLSLSMIAGMVPVLIGQTFASTEHWRWLPLYVGGLGAECAALALWGRDPSSVATIALLAKLATAAVLVLYLAVRRGLGDDLGVALRGESDLGPPRAAGTPTPTGSAS